MLIDNFCTLFDYTEGNNSDIYLTMNIVSLLYNNYSANLFTKLYYLLSNLFIHFRTCQYYLTLLWYCGGIADNITGVYEG